VKTILYPKKVSMEGEKPERWRCTTYVQIDGFGPSKRECVGAMLDRLGGIYKGAEDLRTVSLDDGKSYVSLTEAKKLNAAT
jgi:hypothetical protein